MAKLYKIRAGFSFVFPDGMVKSGGATVELEDDVYEQHAHKLELVNTQQEATTVQVPLVDYKSEEVAPVVAESADQPA